MLLRPRVNDKNHKMLYCRHDITNTVRPWHCTFPSDMKSALYNALLRHTIILLVIFALHAKAALKVLSHLEIFQKSQR